MTLTTALILASYFLSTVAGVLVWRALRGLRQDLTQDMTELRAILKRWRRVADR